jgi:hypothetical protein
MQIYSAVSRQRLDEHVPEAADTNETMIQQRSGVFYVIRAEML